MGNNVALIQCLKDGFKRNKRTRRSKAASTMAPPPSNPVVLSPAVHPVMREVTEDTPPDLLEGTMDLLIVLPSKKNVRMTVSRRTPMMDLLIQVATANKIVPGGHIVQVRNERGIELPYKPSTPIGALDTTTIEIVPKNQVNEYIIVKKQTAKLANQPFEQTFRLQVHLPRNQLYVMRVSPKTLLEDILQEVCREKNLDCNKYEMRHPVKLDEKLPLDRRIGDFGLQEVTVVSRNSRINSSVSTADIMALQHEDGRAKGCLDSAFKHSRSSVGDSSVSSESAASARGISPSRSDDSRSISPLPPVRPKLKLNTTMSNASSSSGTSSSVPKSLLHPNQQQILSSSSSSSSSTLLKTQNLNRSVNSIVTATGTIQAPPRPKKRAAPQPPGQLTSSSQSLPPSVSSTLPSSASTPIISIGKCSTLPSSNIQLNNNNSNSNTSATTAPIRPTPRKKEPPRDPPGLLSTKTTSLPIHHSRHSSDSSGYHEACEPHQHEHHRFDRQQSSPSIGNLSALPPHPRIVSGSVSVSNLTTISSVSTTSLASSNGGYRKRKAPRPPIVAPSLQAQKEIEEEISASTPSLTTAGLDSHNNNNNNNSSNNKGKREGIIAALGFGRKEKNKKPPLLSTKSQQDTSVEEVEVEEEDEKSASPSSPVRQITLVQDKAKPQQQQQQLQQQQQEREERAQHPPARKNNNRGVVEPPLNSQQSLEETINLPSSSAASSLSSSGSSSGNSSQGSTSSSPVPSPDGGSCSTPTATTPPPVLVANNNINNSSSSSQADTLENNSAIIITTPTTTTCDLVRKESETETNSPAALDPDNSNIVSPTAPAAQPQPNMNRPASLAVVEEPALGRTVNAQVNYSSPSSAVAPSSAQAASDEPASAPPPPRKPRTVRAAVVPPETGPTTTARSNSHNVEPDNVNVVVEADGGSSNDAPVPKPKPRPRSAVFPSTTQIDSSSGTDSSSSIPPPATPRIILPARSVDSGRAPLAASEISSAATPNAPSPSRNISVVNRIGIKVLPDGALEARLARLSRQDSSGALTTNNASSLSSMHANAPFTNNKNIAAVTSASTTGRGESPQAPPQQQPLPGKLFKKKARAPDPATRTQSNNGSNNSTSMGTVASSKHPLIVIAPDAPIPPVIAQSASSSSSQKTTDSSKAESVNPYRNDKGPIKTAVSPLSNDNNERKSKPNVDDPIEQDKGAPLPPQHQQQQQRRVAPRPAQRQRQDSETSGESDNLEENLELFELTPHPNNNRLGPPNPSTAAANTTNNNSSSNSEESNRIQRHTGDVIRRKKRKAPVPQALTVNSSSSNNNSSASNNTPIISSSNNKGSSSNGPIKSDSVDMDLKGAITSPDDDDPHRVEDYLFTRTASDRHIQKKSSVGARIGLASNNKGASLDRNSSPGQALNRWQNYESLDAINQESTTSSEKGSAFNNSIRTNSRIPPLLSNNPPTATFNFTKTVPGHHGGSTALQGSTTNTGKKSSVSSHELTSSDLDDKVDAHKMNESGVLSSESEASCTDSGVPATETVTPSPVDIDRSEKDAYSASSSRRSSMEETQNADALREILQSKIAKEQEIIDKAFEGIDADNLDMEDDEMEEDRLNEDELSSSGRKKSSLSNNFDLIKPSSMSNLQESNASSPHPATDHTSDDERDRFSLSSSHDDDDDDDLEEDEEVEDEKKLKFSAESARNVVDPNNTNNTTTTTTSTTTTAASEEGEKKTTTKVSPPARKLSKSESFSHNSEFDVVKMKRKMFSKEGKMSAVMKKSYVSSSDEDLSHERKLLSSPPSTSSSTKPPSSMSGAGVVGRAGSMQNLSTSSQQPTQHSNNNNHHMIISQSSGRALTHAASQDNQMDSIATAAATSHRAGVIRGNVSGRQSSSPENNHNSRNNNNNGRGGVRKAASVLNIQDISPDISQDPQLMASFQTELEAQFEQWKEQFLQRHLRSSKSGSFDSNASKSMDEQEQVQISSIPRSNKSLVDDAPTTETAAGIAVQESVELNNSSREHTVIETKAQVHPVTEEQLVPANNNNNYYAERDAELLLLAGAAKEAPVVIDESKGREVLKQEDNKAEEQEDVREEAVVVVVEESFDPEKPQIIHSVSSTATQDHQPSVPKGDSVDGAVNGNNTASVVGVYASSPAQGSGVTTESLDKAEEAIKENNNIKEDEMPVISSEKSTLPLKKVEEEQQKVYKYAGPPTIQMGTWGDRPHRSVSVKRDNDYIMGMGQHPPKMEIKSTMGTIAARVSSFGGNSTNSGSTNGASNGNSQQTTGTLTRSSTTAGGVNGTVNGRPKSIAIMNSSSVDGNHPTLASSNNNNNSNAPIPKVLSSWKQRLEQNKQSEQNDKRNQSPLQDHIEGNTDSSYSSSSASASIIDPTESRTIVLNSESSSTASTLERPPKKLPSMPMFENNNNNNNSNTLPPSLTRKTFSTRSVDETDSASDYSSSSSRPNSSLSRAPSNASTSNITFGSMSDSTSSSPIPPNSNGSLAERKKLFQGIKPIETNKEAPIPAQNMKGNIANIQKVFQARPPPSKFQVNGGSNGSAPSWVSNANKEASPPAKGITVSLNAPATAAPSPISSTAMVQKVIKAGAFNNGDAFRRTPSPAPAKVEEPKPVMVKQESVPNVRISTNTNRFSVGTYESRQAPTTTIEINNKEESGIKNLGNKSIIIVGSQDSTDSAPSPSATNNIFRQKLKVTSPSSAQSQEPVVYNGNNSKPLASNTVKVNITDTQKKPSSSHNNINIVSKPMEIVSSTNKLTQEKNVVIKRAPSTPLIITAAAQSSVDIPVSSGKVSSIAATLKSSNNGFFNSLQRQAKEQQQSQQPLAPSNNKKDDRPVIIREVEKPRKISADSSITSNGNRFSDSLNNNNNTSNTLPRASHGSSNNIPPPPPLINLEAVNLRPVGSSSASSRPKSISSVPSGPKSPTSPTSGDPRSDIFETIKKSNGNFGLKKTGSTILLN